MRRVPRNRPLTTTPIEHKHAAEFDQISRVLDAASSEHERPFRVRPHFSRLRAEGASELSEVAVPPRPVAVPPPCPAA